MKSKKIRSLSLAERNRILIGGIDRQGFPDADLYFESELPSRAFGAAGNAMLVHQALLARYLLNGGATQSAIRIGRSLLEVYERRGDRLSEDGRAGLLHQLGALFFELYDERSLLRLDSLVARCAGLSQRARDQFRVMLIQSGVCSGRRSWSAAAEKDLLSLKAPADPELAAVIDYFVVLNGYLSRNRAPADLLATLDRSDEIKPDSLQAFYRILKAKVLLRLGRRSEALILLREAGTGLRLDLEIESLFLRRYLLGEKLDMAEEVLLHCHPAPNEYLHLLGNRNMPGGFRLSDVFLDQLPGLRKFELRPEDSDIWRICDRKVTPARYADVAGRRHVLDLRSGVMEGHGGIRLLGRNRSLALACIISTGARGAGELLLAERVYGGERIPVSHALERVRNLVTQLQRLGLPLIRSGRRVRYAFDPARDRILLPRQPAYGGPLDWLRAGKEDISREAMMRVLGISRRSASYSLQRWRNDGLLRQIPGRRGVYEFNDGRATAGWMPGKENAPVTVK